MSGEHEGRLVAERFGGNGEIHEVRSAAEMDEVLRCPALEKRGHGNSPHAEDFVLAGTLIYIWGEEHRRRRRMYAPLVGAAALREIEAWLGPMLQRQLAALPADESGVVRADVMILARDVSLAIAARIIGLDDMDSLARLERLGELGDRLVASLKAHLEFEKSPGMQGATPEELAVAKQRFIARRIAEAKAAKQHFIDEYYAPARARREALVARHRAGELELAQLPKDLITLLILNDAQLRNEPSWDDDLPVRECTMTLAASDHTTSMAACHVVADLCQWVEAHPEDRAKLTDLAFLRRACNESLRLHQVTDPATNWRHAREDVTLKTGRSIAAGDRVALWYGVGGMDRDYYGADVATFNPWRVEAGNLRRPYGFAFSGGSKVCLGLALVAGAGGEEDARADDFRGDLPLMMQAFFAAGMRTDQERPAVPRSHVHASVNDTRELLMWKSFPVVFDRLGPRFQQTQQQGSTA